MFFCIQAEPNSCLFTKLVLLVPSVLSPHQNDTSAENSSTSATAVAVEPAQTARASYEDVIHYASIKFKGDEAPLYSNIRQHQSPKQREDVVYSSVKFSRPSAATQWVFLCTTPDLILFNTSLAMAMCIFNARCGEIPLDSGSWGLAK